MKTAIKESSTAQKVICICVFVCKYVWLGAAHELRRRMWLQTVTF